MMKKIIIVLFLITGILTVRASAEDVVPAHSGETSADELLSTPHDYVFPTIEPEAYLSTGYRYIHMSGDRKVGEFEFPHSSITLGGELRLVNERHRLHLDAGYNNQKDYEGDLSYAFKDRVLFRWINSTLYHNLDNTPPVDLDPATTTTAAVNVFDTGKQYGRTVGMNSLLLRLKAPDFPAHLYFEGFFVDKDGTQQQKFLGGAASIRSRTVRVSEKRDVDLETRIYTVGVNSHLGPVEIDYAHSEKRLSVGQPDPVYTYLMPASGAPPLPCAAPGCSYSHNGMPELMSSTDTLKIHTTYTGQIAASATLSKTEKDNRENSAQADFLYGAADLTYMPSERITMFLKYRHKESELESPDLAYITNLTSGAVYSSNVYQPISSVSDMYSASVRFRALPNITLKGEINLENIRRENNEEWNTPDSTEKTNMILSSDMKLFKHLKLKLKFTHKNINDPAHNIEPESSDELYASLSWNPIKNLTTFLSYSSRHDSRDHVHYLYADSIGDEHDLLFGARKVDNERVTGVVNYMVLNNVSITGSYAFGRTTTKQDITYACNTGGCIGTDPAGTPYADPMVPFKTIVQTFGLDLTYQPTRSLTLNGGVSHTTAQGRFSPSNLLGQSSIDDFSELKTRETIYSVSGEYLLRKGFGIGLNYRYATFKDAYDNMLDDVNDGRVHIVFLTLSKKW
ncbi:MAG: MtrB/PioB family outer membrane beta-barrel protein [Nitrospirae bacterium]|nr:MtrB/PioB family outer membrane beta-barrel protein [Nitrospirota bacterium]